MNIARRCLVKLIPQQRGFSAACTRLSPRKAPEEVRIPVPWGYVAGKWWGPRDKEPVLAVHGWQDNANSFDPLIELLPEDLAVFAFDLPGNGISSHLPPFQNYYYSDAIGLVRRVKNYLRLGQLRLLGHSGGSAVCFLYATTFPEDVHSYFGIDYVAHVYTDEDKRAESLGKEIDRKIELALRDHSDSRRYTWEEAKQVWIKATKHSLNEKSCEILMKRGVTTFPDGKVIFSRDHRLKTADINIYNPAQVRKFAENIRCHVHIVKGLQSDFMPNCLKPIPDLLDIIKGNAESYEYSELDGKHHLHMDIPEQFVPLFLKLIQKSEIKHVSKVKESN